MEGLYQADQVDCYIWGLATSPESGYGYIESLDELSNKNKSSSIKKFIEKPSEEIAKNLFLINIHLE